MNHNVILECNRETCLKLFDSEGCFVYKIIDGRVYGGGEAGGEPKF